MKVRWQLSTAVAILCFNLGYSAALSSLSHSSPWTWVCRDEICIKTDKSELRGQGVPVDVCKINCGKYGTLLPRPTGQIEIGRDFFHFSLGRVEFARLPSENDEFAKLFAETERIFRENLAKMQPKGERSDSLSENRVIIKMKGAWDSRGHTLKADESYTLTINHEHHNDSVMVVTITASTYFGAHHGLETLSQLIAFDEENDSFATVTRAKITDKPVYPYRGLMLDTARNFYSVGSIKRIIDGMSSVKLNIFHWHITDTHSFPFTSTREPKLTQYGAYSKREVYTVQDMKEIVEYAKVRGVKVIPEFDQPAHVGNGWQWGPAHGLGDLALCINAEPWQEYCVEPPCGQLNVVNENVFHVLGNLYKDFLDVFSSSSGPTDIFHMGGDEINYNCWNGSKQITHWLRKEGKDLSKASFIDLWGLFQEKAYQKLKDANHGHDLTAILWSSDITDAKYIEKYLNSSRYIIQTWSASHDASIGALLDKGYRVIFSNYDAWYLDCGYGGWVGVGPNNWCSPYKGWQQVYRNDPVKIYAKLTTPAQAEEALSQGLILGGSAQLWSEQADEQSADSKIWPRAAALAERLWTNPSYDWDQLEYRMAAIRERLITRGMHADRLQPQWCYQNEGHCYLNPAKI